MNQTSKESNNGETVTMSSNLSSETTVIEVYEYPVDCVASELSYHFSRQPYFAECRTPLHVMWNYRSSSFILEFTSSDAVKILQTPVQLLDEEDPKSEIRLSLLDERRCAQVLVTSQHEISYRMIRQFFRKFGELKSCQQSSGSGEYSIIITFKQRSDAEKVCSAGTHKIGPAVTVHTQLLTEAIVNGEPSSPTATSFTLDFNFDSISCVNSAPIEPQPHTSTTATDDASKDADSGVTDGSYHTLETSAVPLNTAFDTESLSTDNSSATEEDDDSHHYETLDLKSVSKESPQMLVSSVPSTTYSVPSYTAPTVCLNSCVQVNNCVIRLIHGDISDHIADVLVHSGGLAKQALARKWYIAPEPIQNVEVISAPGHGNISVTTAPNLPASYIFGFKFNNEPSTIAESCRRLTKLCLQHCDMLKRRSVAFPALGTGMYGEKPKVMAASLVSSVVEYMKLNTQSTLEIIDLVIFQSRMLKDFDAALKEASSVSRSYNFTKILSRRRGRVENVYQISDMSNKINVDEH